MLELVPGDVIYKCQHGTNIKLRLKEKPALIENVLRWRAEIIDINGDTEKAGNLLSFNAKSGAANAALFLYPYFYTTK